ncbi:hypothetical protein KAJ87_02305 [Candidatus Pacearchaeota archaeon]|nr:hypothetical protein [Candidatus Pacearchaeota archaeon]
MKGFFRGIMRVLEIYPTQKKLGDYFPHYNSKTGSEQDAQALTEDWRKVGNDLERALGKI